MGAEARDECRECGAAVALHARWCGTCGAATDRVGAGVAAESGDAETGATDPGATDPVVPDGESRAPRRLVPGAVVVALTVLVAAFAPRMLGGPPATFEALAAGASAAGPHDAARTGLVHDASVPAPRAPRWAVDLDLADPPADVSSLTLLHDDVVLTVEHHDGGERVVATGRARADGTLLWWQDTEAGRFDGLHLASRAAGGVLARDGDDWVRLDPSTGEPTASGPPPSWATPAGVVDVVRSPEPHVRVSSVEAAQATAISLPPAADGEPVPAGDFVGVVSAPAGHLVLVERWTPPQDDGTMQRYAVVVDVEHGRVLSSGWLPLVGTSEDVGWADVVLVDASRVVVRSEDDESRPARVLDLEQGVLAPEVLATDVVQLHRLADAIALVRQGEGGALETVVLDGDDLRERWRAPGGPGGWANIAFSTTHLLLEDGDGTRVHDLATGEATLVDLPDGPRSAMADDRGTAAVVGSRTSYRSHDGAVAWDESFDARGVATVVPFGDGVLVLSDREFVLLDADGTELGRDEIRGATGDGRWGARDLLAARGERLLVARGRDRVGMLGADLAPQWETALDGVVSGVVATADGDSWVATDAQVVRLDEDSRVLARLGTPGVTSLSAGPGSVAAMTGRCREQDCRAVLRLLDADDLSTVWTAQGLQGACGPVTLAGDHVAVPTHVGVTFLDGRTGEVAATWALEGEGCTSGIAHADGRFVAVRGRALEVGRVGEATVDVAFDAPVVGRPVVAGRQVLVSTGQDVVALSLDGSEAWRHRLRGPIASAPAVLPGRDVVVALRDGRVVRLRA